MVYHVIALVYIVWTALALIKGLWEEGRKDSLKDLLPIAAMVFTPIVIGGLIGYKSSKKNKLLYAAIGVYLGQVIPQMIIRSWFAIGMMSYGAGKDFSPLKVVLKFFGENLVASLTEPFKYLLGL